MSTSTLRVFIMYAHEDKPVRDKLLQHFRPMVRRGDIDLWSDHEIRPGALWDEEIRTRLNTSDLIIMLVSDDFFASEYIHNVEMESALIRHERGETRLVPVIARYCAWEDVSEIARLQVLPSGGKPVLSKGWDAEDQPYVNIVKGVREAMRDLRKSQTPKQKKEPVPAPQDDNDRRPVRQKPVIYAALAIGVLLLGIFLFQYGAGIFKKTSTKQPDKTQQEEKKAAQDEVKKQTPEDKKADTDQSAKPPNKPPATRKEEQKKAAPPQEQPKPYDKAYDTSEGMLRVKKGRLWGYKNLRTGKIIGWYDDAEPFDRGRAGVSKGGAYYYIDKAGNKIK